MGRVESEPGNPVGRSPTRMGAPWSSAHTAGDESREGWPLTTKEKARWEERAVRERLGRDALRPSETES